MDELTEYQRRRLELADMLRAALPVARRSQDDQRDQEIRALLTRLASGRFRLAVAGQFSRGKTTLMNALLGGAYLPMGALPMTSVITTVRYGTRARALVRSAASSLPVEVGVSEVGKFVAQSSADRTRMQVSSVEVEIPAELLRLGFEFIDTPGVGSAIAANTAATVRFLPEADAVVFVTGFDSAITEAEAEFLATTAGQAAKLFLVINKRDLVTGTDAADVARYVRRWVLGNLHADPAIFGLSALTALHGAMHADREQITDSGLEPFRAALIQFLAAERGKTSLRAVATAAASLLHLQQRDMSAGRLPRNGGPDRDAVVARFEARMRELPAWASAIADRIADRVRATTPGLLAERGPAWRSELHDVLEPAASSWLGQQVEHDVDPLQSALSALDLAGRQVAGDCLARWAAEVNEAVITAAGSDIGALLELARSPREMGAEIAGLSARNVSPAGWLSAEVPVLQAPVVPWVTPEPPTQGRLRRRLGGPAADSQSLIGETLANAVAAFIDRAVIAFQEAAVHWTGRLRDQAERQAAQEATRFQRYLSAPPREEDLALLADLNGRIVAYLESLASWVPETNSSQDRRDRPDVLPDVEPELGCSVCTQMEAALTMYLMQGQFLLATSEDSQARHAQAGGFCPLHTWQYAQMASPVAISAGNATLARVLADELSAIGTRCATGDDLASEVARLARARACPACAILADAEGRAVAQVAAADLSDTAPILCLRHLALVLGAGPPLEAGASMVGALASVLRRASQDMRSFALKREAVRRDLITADEDSAYSRALQLLASRPALAQLSEPE
ncbi:MAG TPA: dynamin family protein [Streptosporangiaceae bacterium]|nr:dynamin family protein [Streptosporangiaceae bacterium]